MSKFLENAKINPSDWKNVKSLWCECCKETAVQTDESNGNFFVIMSDSGEAVFFTLCHECQK